MNVALAVAALAASLTAAAPVPVAFGQFFRAGSARLEPSDTLLGLDGKQVRLVGFMARMEEGPRGSFYLASRPVECDEGGAGTGDLPPDAVLVVVPWAQGEEVPFLPGPLEVVGVLHLGAPIDPQGAPARIRVVLDPPTPKSTHGGSAP